MGALRKSYGRIPDTGSEEEGSEMVDMSGQDESVSAVATENGVDFGDASSPIIKVEDGRASGAKV